MLVCRFSLLILTFFTFSSFANVQHSLNILPTGSRAAIIVENTISQNIEFQQKQDELFPPASTLKIATALAARLALSEQFTFATTLSQSANNIILTFSGDPSLTRQDLANLFDKSAINTIQGDLWIDDTLFTGYERAVGWPWDILGVCYSAPSSALSIDENCVQASITTHNDGSTKVFVPSHQPISFTSNARSVSREEQESSFCDLELTTQGNHYQLSGCLIKRNKPLPLKFAIQNTQDFTQQTIRKILAQHNITLTGNIRFGTPSIQYQQQILARHNSKPLMQLLDHMLKKSDNHYADNLTKMLGHLTYQQPGSFSNGTAAIKDILLKQADIDLSNAVFVDGSGLSRNNRMTANQMKNILQFIYHNDSRLGLIELLPIAGIDGTLLYRNSMRKDPIKNSIKSKSGSLFGSYNMAGFAGLQNKKPQLFVQFIADYHPVTTAKEPEYTERAIDTFEKAFYRELIILSNK